MKAFLGADGKTQTGLTPTAFSNKFPIAVSFSSRLLVGGAYLNFSLLLPAKAQDVITLNLPSVSPPTAVTALFVYPHWCAVNK